VNPELVAERWKARSTKVCGDRRVLQGAEATADPRTVITRGLETGSGELAAFPNLKGDFPSRRRRGRRHADQSLPNVPLVPSPSADLTGRMTEYVVAAMS